jgi:hypothetical protein
VSSDDRNLQLDVLVAAKKELFLKRGPPEASMSVDLTTPFLSHLDETTNKQLG